MFHINLAGHVFTVENRYPYVEKLCRNYTSAVPGERIKISQEEISFENRDGRGWPDGYLESLAVYRKICESLLKDNVLLFHCSALSLDGKAYLFTAPSGTGKSTHASLWRERFGDRIVMINDDKPLLFIQEKKVTVYGTPYSGKGGLHTNTSAPVAGIVFLHQAAKNTIKSLTPREAYPRLLSQCYCPSDPCLKKKAMDLAAGLSCIPVFSLGCSISQEAVEMAYRCLSVL